MRRHTRDGPAAAFLPLRKKSKLASYAGAALLASVLIGGFAAPARAEVDVHLGFGVPYYYPYHYPRTYYEPHYYSYYDAPRYHYRRSWQPGHWERRYSGHGRYVRVWVPGYYRY
jgi:hypothetical protein